MTSYARIDPLLLHQFLSGLPGPISRQLHASSDTKDLKAVVQCAKMSVTVMEHKQVAALIDCHMYNTQ